MSQYFQIFQPSSDPNCCNSNSVPPDPCCNNGALFQIDWKDAIYHKDNNTVTSLDGLGLNNGATLNQAIEILDEKIKGVNATGFFLPFLRFDGTIINTLQQFAQAVDNSLSLLDGRIDILELVTAIPLTANDSDSIDFSTSGALNHTLTGTVKISVLVNNNLTSQPDGLFINPQQLSVDYTTKKLTISQGNTVDLASLMCGASGFLGNFTTDPTVIGDGQYFYNTSQGKLKIKLNSAIREIVLV